MIPFNKPCTIGNELEYIKDAISVGKLCGNGKYTNKCQSFFEQKYGFKKCLLTTSCTDALEMCAILLDIQAGDEVIMPSYTFVSTSNAFVLRGAKIVFADSEPNNPNMDCNEIEKLITPKTKCIVVVHYAGASCDMEKAAEIAKKHNIFLVEDAAQAVDNFYINKSGDKIPLGSIGNLAAFSFHETKNIICGEGGMLVVNDENFIKRSEIIWEKGTNRSAYFRGEIDKYGWVDVGSSFLMSELTAAYLWAQLESIKKIQTRRLEVWNLYNSLLNDVQSKYGCKIQAIPIHSTNNAHAFYMVCNSTEERGALIKYLKENDAQLVFHYLSLHKSAFYSDKHDGRELPHSDRYSDCLVRLPIYYDITNEQVQKIAEKISEFYATYSK